MTASVAERRIKKELQKLRKAGDEVGMTVEVGACSTEWFVTIVGEMPGQADRGLTAWAEEHPSAVLSPRWFH